MSKRSRTKAVIPYRIVKGMRRYGFKMNSRTQMFNHQMYDSVPFSEAESYIKKTEHEESLRPGETLIPKDPTPEPPKSEAAALLDKLCAGDLHLRRGFEILRNMGKSANFGELYGMSNQAKIHGPYTGRWSSSTHNLQIQPKTDDTPELAGKYVEVYEDDTYKRLCKQIPQIDMGEPEFDEAVFKIKSMLDLRYQLLRARREIGRLIRRNGYMDREYEKAKQEIDHLKKERMDVDDARRYEVDLAIVQLLSKIRP